MYNKYPYTDFSELNLDWFLEQFKTLKEEWQSTEEQWAVMQQNFQTLEGVVQTFTTFVENYFENLDVQQEINNKLDQMALDGTLSTLLAPLVDDKLPDVVDTKLPAELATQLPGEVTTQLPGVVADQIDAAVAPGIPAAVTAWLVDNVNPVGSAVTIDSSLTIAGSAADAKVTGERIENVNSEIGQIVTHPKHIYDYLYKEGYVINASELEAANNSYNLYKIPVSEKDIVVINQIDNSTPFWGSYTNSIVFHYLNSNNTYSACGANTAVYNISTGSRYSAAWIIPANVTHIMVVVDKRYISNVIFNKNTTFNLSQSVDPFRTVVKLTNNNTMVTRLYRNDSNVFAGLPNPYYSQLIKVHAGDRLHFDNPKLYSNVAASSLTDLSTMTTALTTASDVTVLNDSLLCAFVKAGENESNVTIYPYNSLQVNAKDLIDPEDIFQLYKGLKGVAFGTSLTYKSQTTGGYLNFLPTLSQMTWDNQGAGSATILTTPGNPDILDIITNYAGYADKRVCIIEGFVNDWYLKNPLGTYKDTGVVTVCGCLRNAISHILTQNPDITVYVILDHFGSGAIAPLATNGDGLTQLDYYQTIEKTALSMGIRVIREYEVSEISELTPQYLLDTIHLNMLGAEQSANAIWSVMKTQMPNIT